MVPHKKPKNVHPKPRVAYVAVISFTYTIESIAIKMPPHDIPS